MAGVYGNGTHLSDWLESSAAGGYAGWPSRSGRKMREVFPVLAFGVSVLGGPLEAGDAGRVPPGWAPRV